MSPREWTELVEDWPRYVSNRLYRMVVIDVQKQKTQDINLILRHLDGEQAGRTVQILLPRPIRAEGLAASLFRAGGQDIAAGQRVKPRALLNVTVGVRF